MQKFLVQKMPMLYFHIFVSIFLTLQNINPILTQAGANCDPLQAKVTLCQYQCILTRLPYAIWIYRFKI